MMSNRWPTAPFWALAVLICGACADDGRKPLSPVEGQVFFEGKPAEGAMVILHPLEKDLPERPLGNVDQDGAFKLTTYNLNDGAPPGNYAATVIWMKETEYRGVVESVEEVPSSVNLLPARYADPKASKLRVEIKEGANQLEPFHLVK